MGDSSTPKNNEKAAKVHRTPERERQRTLIFVATRHTANEAHHSQLPSRGLLQRRCSCGKHTIAGGVCEECQQKQDAGLDTAAIDTQTDNPANIQTSRETTTHFNLSAVPANSLTTSNGRPVQPTLTVNAPHDQYEQEADSVAEAVMRMPERLQAPAPPAPPSAEGNHFSQTNVSRLPQISPIQTSGRTITFSATTSNIDFNSIQRVETSNQSETATSEQNGEEARADEVRHNLTIGDPSSPYHQVLENATTRETLDALQQHYRYLNGWLTADEERHRMQHDQRERHFIVGAISDLMGGVEMPPLNMWGVVHVHLNAAQGTGRAGLVGPTVRNLRRAEDAWRVRHRRLMNYIDGTISGAETSVTVLEYTAVAGAVAAGVATGGAATAAGYGLVGTSVASGLSAAAYGATQEFAGQTGEMGAGLRESYEADAILRRAAIDGATALVGSLVGGALSNAFKRAFGSYIASSIGDDVLIELGEQMGLGGPLPRDYFLTGGQQFIADFLGGVASSPLSTAVTALINSASGGPSPASAEDFFDQVIDEMVEGGIMDLFVSALTHAHAHVSSSSRGGRGTHRDSPSTSHSDSHVQAPHADASVTHPESASPPSSEGTPEPSRTSEITSSEGTPNSEPETGGTEFLTPEHLRSAREWYSGQHPELGSTPPVAPEHVPHSSESVIPLSTETTPTADGSGQGTGGSPPPRGGDRDGGSSSPETDADGDRFVRPSDLHDLRQSSTDPEGDRYVTPQDLHDLRQGHADSAQHDLPRPVLHERLSSAGDPGTLAGHGPGCGVFRATMPNGTIVAIKVYPDTPAWRNMMNAEMTGAQGAATTSVGPQFYGEVEVDAGIGFAMELVEGSMAVADMPNPSPGHIQEADQTARSINDQTFADINTYEQELLDAGYVCNGEAQGLIDASGRWRPIDFQATEPLSEDPTQRARQLAQHRSSFEQERHLLEQQRHEVNNQSQ